MKDNLRYIRHEITTVHLLFPHVFFFFFAFVGTKDEQNIVDGI